MNKQKIDGWSALMLACQDGFCDVVETLLDKGAEVNTHNIEGWSSLTVASRYGHNNVVKQLLNKGAEVNTQINDGWSSLMLASRNGYNDVVKTLLAKGAEVNMQKIDGWSSLMLASQDGHTDTARVLLDNHADITIQNVDGDTALDIAIKRAHEDIIELLAGTVQDSSDSPSALVLESIIHTTDETDQQDNVTTPDTTLQGAAPDDGELSPVHNQEEESRDPPKISSELRTLGASNIIIPEEYATNLSVSGFQDKCKLQ